MGDPPAKIMNNAENSRKIIVVANGQRRLLTVPGNYVEQSFLLSEFGRGRLVYKLRDVKPKSSQDSNENGASDFRLMNSKCSNENKSPNKRERFDSFNVDTCTPNKNFSSSKHNKSPYVRRVIYACCLYKESSSAVFLLRGGISNVIGVNGNIDYSINDLIEILKIELGKIDEIQDLNFSDEKHTFQLGFRDSTCIHEFRDKQGNPCDFWTWAKKYRTSRHELKMALLVAEKVEKSLGKLSDSSLGSSMPPESKTKGDVYGDNQHREGDSRKSDELFDDHLCANTSGSSAPAGNLHPEYFPPPFGDVEEYIEPSTVHLNSNALKGESSSLSHSVDSSISSNSNFSELHSSSPLQEIQPSPKKPATSTPSIVKELENSDGCPDFLKPACTTPSPLSRSGALLNEFRVEESEINFSNITLGGGLQGTVTQGRYRMTDVAI
ncbi:hypothetical protein QAD02_018403 [Eretmocerus hayati]|uniref:Uncharacterized protein n=1 Tax=Eretmocerus hayati TaxID=131215 RepID=A0ACC2PGP8_9HYME|nr:hypothetical protein QAD02_018403 [Eretmocerus hayati]